MKFRQTLLNVFAAILMLSATTCVQAQPYMNAEDALNGMEAQMQEIEDLLEKSTKIMPAIRTSVEDADFRAQQPLFRKMHVILDAIESHVYAISTTANQAFQFDPRLDISEIQEACIYLGANEDFASLALMDVAAAVHEGDAALVEKGLDEAEAALRGLQFLLDNSGLEIRNLRREL